MGRHQIHATINAAILTCAFLTAAWAAPVLAQDRAEQTAREIADHVMSKGEQSPHGDLGSWSRSVLERALGHATNNTHQTPVPLPAENQAGRLAANLSASRQGQGAEVIVFMSLSVPATAWREWSREASRIGAPLVLRGVTKGGLRATVKRIGTYLMENTAAAIDPRLFRLFAIEAVPAVAVVPGGIPPCKRRGCSGDPAPPHDLVSGNVGLDAALRIIAYENGPGRETARRHRARLRGEFP